MTGSSGLGCSPTTTRCRSWRRWRASWSARSLVWRARPGWADRALHAAPARLARAASARRRRDSAEGPGRLVAMRPGLRLALCQINATVGDLDGNATLIASGIEEAKR